MNILNVTFAGHRRIEKTHELEKKMECLLIELVKTSEFIDFYVGNDGDFDILATSLIRRVRKKVGSDNSAINLVLPYKKANLDLIEEQFDSVIIPERFYNIHPKRAITERNRFMIDNCDLLICHIEQKGGAANTLKYAESKGNVKIIYI